MHDDLIKFIDKKDLIQLRTALRQAFIRSKYRAAFLKTKRIEVIKYKKDGKPCKRPGVFYKCEKCLELVKSENLNVDHIKCIGSFKDILEFFDFFLRVFCAFSNLQVLCKICHSRKTKFERMTFNKL